MSDRENEIIKKLSAKAYQSAEVWLEIERWKRAKAQEERDALKARVAELERQALLDMKEVTEISERERKAREALDRIADMAQTMTRHNEIMGVALEALSLPIGPAQGEEKKA